MPGFSAPQVNEPHALAEDLTGGCPEPRRCNTRTEAKTNDGRARGDGLDLGIFVGAGDAEGSSDPLQVDGSIGRHDDGWRTGLRHLVHPDAGKTLAQRRYNRSFAEISDYRSRSRLHPAGSFRGYHSVWEGHSEADWPNYSRNPRRLRAM